MPDTVTLVTLRNGDVRWARIFAQDESRTILYTKTADTDEFLTYSTPMTECPRCLGKHERVTFERLTHALDAFSWWGLCPDTQEPILISFSGAGPQTYPCPMCSGTGALTRTEGITDEVAHA